jgi:hypothetical protein
LTRSADAPYVRRRFLHQERSPLDAIIRDRESLVALVRARQDQLNIPCLNVDEIAGLAGGHFSKLTCGIKGFGFLSLFLVLEALGLRLRIEEDPEAVARLQHRWTPRQNDRGNQPSAIATVQPLV